MRHPIDIRIVAGASSSSSQYIRDRVALVTGKTFDEVKASGITYLKPIRGRPALVPYTYGDYAYDPQVSVISIGSASPQPDSAQFAAWCDMIESYETACHVYSGDEPLN